MKRIKWINDLNRDDRLERIVFALLQLEKTYQVWADKQAIDDTNEPFHNFELIHLALDILGIPPDSEDEDEGSCREFFYTAIFDICVKKHNDPQMFIAVANSEIELPDAVLPKKTLTEKQIENILYPKKKFDAPKINGDNTLN